MRTIRFWSGWMPEDMTCNVNRTSYEYHWTNRPRNVFKLNDSEFCARFFYEAIITHLTNFTNFSPFEAVLRHQRPLVWSGLFQVMHNVERLHKCVSICKVDKVFMRYLYFTTAMDILKGSFCLLHTQHQAFYPRTGSQRCPLRHIMPLNKQPHFTFCVLNPM